MVNAEVARTVVGVIGNVISYCLFLSPLPTFVGIIKKKDTESFKADPYLATLMNCMLWIFYGLPFVHPNSILVITTNGVGLVLELAFLIIYFTFANRKQRLRVLRILAIELAAVALIASLVLTQAHTYELRTKIVGILCIIFGTAMYASPLTIMSRVIKTKSVKYMPILLSIANFLNGICWTIYAVIKFDLNIIIPNGLGAILGAVQLILYWWYYKTTNWDVSDDEGVKHEIQLQTTNTSILVETQ